jgi:hypothetical protein
MSAVEDPLLAELMAAVTPAIAKAMKGWEPFAAAATPATSATSHCRQALESASDRATPLRQDATPPTPVASCRMTVAEAEAAPSPCAETLVADVADVAGISAVATVACVATATALGQARATAALSESSRRVASMLEALDFLHGVDARNLATALQWRTGEVLGAVDELRKAGLVLRHDGHFRLHSAARAQIHGLDL